MMKELFKSVIFKQYNVSIFGDSCHSMKSTDIAEKIITRNLQKDFLKAHGVAKFHKENDKTSGWNAYSLFYNLI